MKMSKKQFTVMLVVMLAASFLGGALAVTLLNGGQANAAEDGEFAGIGADGGLAWAINTRTGAVRAFTLSGKRDARIDTRKILASPVWSDTSQVWIDNDQADQTLDFVEE